MCAILKKKLHALQAYFAAAALKMMADSDSPGCQE
jgi:hypothetical protein